MMNNVVLLTKVLIKNGVFSFSSKKSKKESSTRGSVFGFLFVMLFCVTCIGGPVIYLLNDILKVYDLSELILSFVLPLGAITTIIFGVFSITSVFYFNKDSESLLPLPIKSSELLMSKFIASLISEYFILIMFIFPVIIGVGIGVNASLLYYLYSLIIFILMPIIPSIIMAIIIMLANKIFNFGKKKDLFMYVMTGLILIFSFAYSFGLEVILSSEEDSALFDLLSGDSKGYLNFTKLLFPLFNSATYSLVHYKEFLGLASIMTFIGLNILFIVVLYFVGDKLYVKGLTKDGGRKQNKKEKTDTIYRKSSTGVIGELIKKEWISIKRTPIFMLNTVISNLIFPVIFIGSFLLGMGNESDLNLADFINFSSSGVFVIVIGILILFCSMANAASSAISREGNSAYVMKIIPISYKKQMDAKVYFSTIIDVIALIMLEIAAFVFIKLPLNYLLINIPIIIALLIINYISLILDLRKPKLDWMEESEAVKQNFNVFLSMLISLIISGLIIALGVASMDSNINIYLMFALISVILLLVYILINVLVKKYQDKLFSKVG